MEIVDPRLDAATLPWGTRPLVIAERQTRYENLPAVITPDGQVITRWALTEAERKSIFFGADVFVTILSFNRPVNPLIVSIGPRDWKVPL